MHLPDVETDSLRIKLRQFKVMQQAAHKLMRQDQKEQAVTAYVKLADLILEIEIEIASRRKLRNSA